MRRSYIYDSELKKLVPKEEYVPKERRAPYIQPDLPDYRPMGGPEAEKFFSDPANAKLISGRKQHREYLRRNGFIEVGNEKEAFLRHGGKTPDNPFSRQPSPEVRKYLEAAKRDR